MCPKTKDIDKIIDVHFKLNSLCLERIVCLCMILRCGQGIVSTVLIDSVLLIISASPMKMFLGIVDVTVLLRSY